MNWEDAITNWKNRGCSVLKPTTSETISAAEAKIGPLPEALISLYAHCNGLNYGWFRILPVEDPADIKKTWDGLVRANTAPHSSILEIGDNLLQCFLVFSRMDAGKCAVIDQMDASIWFEDEGELHQTNLNLLEFIEVALREVEEL